jgi:hypothetical protein
VPKVGEILQNQKEMLLGLLQQLSWSVRVDAVRKIAAGLFADVGFNHLPIILVVAIFRQLANLGGEGEDALGHAEAHADGGAVERFGEEVLDAGGGDGFVVEVFQGALEDLGGAGVVLGDEDFQAARWVRV